MLKEEKVFSTIKGYGTAAIAVAIAIFVAIFKYRGNKITELEADVESVENKLEVASKVVAKEKEVAKFVADNRVAKVEVEMKNDESDKHYNPNDTFYI